MEIIKWFENHFMVISLVWFPAFLGYLNAFVASCKVMGWSKLAETLGKVEDAIATFVSTLKQNQGGSNDKKDSSVDGAGSSTVPK